MRGKPGRSRPPRGGIRYGLRPARIPPRDQPTIEKINEPDKDLHFTADHLKVGFHPWLNIRSERWLKFGSAPTALRLSFGCVAFGFVSGLKSDRSLFATPICSRASYGMSMVCRCTLRCARRTVHMK